MMHPETASFAHAFINNAARTHTRPDPNAQFDAVSQSLLFKTLEHNDDRAQPGHTGKPGDYEIPLLACAGLLDYLSAEIAHVHNDRPLNERVSPNEYVFELDTLSRTQVLRDTYYYRGVGGTADAALTVALMDYTINRSDPLDGDHQTVFLTAMKVLHQYDERNTGGTATSYYQALLNATSELLFDVVTKLSNVTHQDPAVVLNNLRQFVREQPNPDDYQNPVVRVS